MEKYCDCGCGKEVTPGKKFLRGHYIRTKKALERLDMTIPSELVKPKQDVYDIHGVGFALPNKMEINIVDTDFDVDNNEPIVETNVGVFVTPEPNKRTLNAVVVACNKCHFFGYVHVLVAQTGVCPKCQKRI
jgi:hypothetical protein